MPNKTNTDRETFGQFIKRFRETNGYSLRKMEELTKVSYSSLNRIERGDAYASRDVVLAIAKGINWDKDDLLIIAGHDPDPLGRFIKEEVEKDNSTIRTAMPEESKQTIKDVVRTIFTSGAGVTEERIINHRIQGGRGASRTQSILGNYIQNYVIPNTEPEEDEEFTKNRFLALNRDNSTCQYCGVRAPSVLVEVSHIIPKSRGGEDTLDNLITVCHSCNVGKALIEKEMDKKEANKTDKELLDKWEVDLNNDLNKLDTGLVDDSKEIGTKVNVYEGLPED